MASAQRMLVPRWRHLGRVAGGVAMISAAGLRRGRFPPGAVFVRWVDGLLGAIGLDEGQESAYRALVALGAAEVPDLAHRLTLPVPQTERALRHLERRGL